MNETAEKYIRTLPGHKPGNAREVIWFGNGFNLCFGMNDWDEVIGKLAEEYGTEELVKSCGSLPETMRIVALTRDNVDRAMQSFASVLRSQVLSAEHAELYRRLFSLPVDDFLTTDYDFLPERSLDDHSAIARRSLAGEPSGAGTGGNSLRGCRRWTKKVTETEKQFHLYEYTENRIGGKEKRIWHLHGDLFAPSSIVMGHYYYGKAVRCIGDRIRALMKSGELRNRDVPFAAQSWVDLFLTSDVHVIGFGAHLSEFDFWWLLCEKKRLFPETKVYFHCPEGKLDGGTGALLSAYGAEICTYLLREIGTDAKGKKKYDYTGYYLSVIEKLGSVLGGEEQG